jgi:hypothetical protein
MSLHVPNIDQSGCSRDVSKSGGHNLEVEISKVACWPECQNEALRTLGRANVGAWTRITRNCAPKKQILVNERNREGFLVAVHNLQAKDERC